MRSILRSLWFAGVLGVCCGLCHAEPPVEEETPAERPGGENGVFPLIEKDSLEGWLFGDWANIGMPPKPSGTPWKYEDGELIGLGKRSWIFSENEFGDFLLTFEWKLSPGANAGVGLRFPPDGDPARQGLEIQLVDEKKHYPSGCRPEQRTGAIYGEVAPSQQAAKKVGEWNMCEITCEGDRVQVTLNGKQVLDVDQAALTSSRQSGGTPLAMRPRQGSIGFQNQSGTLWLRNLKIKYLGKEVEQAEEKDAGDGE